MKINIDDIRPNPAQPRQYFEPESLQELADSIKTQGLIQPIAVRPNGSGYIIIHGERRWRAHKLAGLTKIEANIVEVDDSTAYTMAVIENEQREDISPIETAQALKKMMDEHELTQDEVAQRISRSRTWVAQKLRLLNLPGEVCEAINTGDLTEAHGRQLLKLKSANITDEKIRTVAENAKTGQWTVKRIENEVGIMLADSVSQDTKSELLITPIVSQDTKPAQINSFKLFWRSLTPDQQRAAYEWLKGEYSNG